MTIHQIAEGLNQKAVDRGYQISFLPELRKQFLKKKKLPKRIFTYHTIFEDNGYAFHHGGRDEIQFNIGADSIGDTQYTRYALCFSLEASPSLTDPVTDLDPFRKRFNKCIDEHPEYFRDFEMWYYQNNKRHGNFPSQKISDNWFRYGTFIAIGKMIPKPLDQINETDLTEILNGFDKLLPIYQYCVLQSPSFVAKEKRISRICWNTNGWIIPSGRYGKSKDKKSHEAKHGYGHEEWLFDIGKIIDGYHYGFLEPISKQHQAFVNKMYDVWLYTIDGTSKKRFWIGEIKNVEVIDAETADEIKKIYKSNGWLKEMEAQIKTSGSNGTGFSNWKGVSLFNIRFLPTDLKINEQYCELPKNHKIYTQSRYAFGHFKDEFAVIPTDDVNDFSFSSSAPVEPENKEGELKVKTYSSLPKQIEITFLHEAISESLTSYLGEKYGVVNVAPNKRAGYGLNKIDIVVNSPEGLLFYEIKTYNSLKACIREAIGQLMEYSLWTNKNKAKKLIVVSQPTEDIEKAKIYFSHLRDTYNLPLYYQSYDYQKKLLSELY